MYVNSGALSHHIDLTDVIIFVIASPLLIRQAHVYICINKEQSNLFLFFLSINIMYKTILQFHSINIAAPRRE